MQRLLIIGSVWPEPKSSAAGSRMMQLIGFFQEEDYHITFTTTCTKTENAQDLKPLGIDEVPIELNNSSFDTFIKNLNPDIVLFDRFMIEEQFGWRVAEQCPKTIRILDTEDLHGLRKGRHQALKNNRPFNKDYLFNDTAMREIASIYRCDLSLIISEAEMTILKNDFKVDPSLLHYLPFLLNEITSETRDSLPALSERKDFITIGNFLHAPNLDAVRYLKDTVWPLIREQLPEVKLHIYGAYASQKVEQLHSEKDGFLVKGFAADVHAVMQKARVCIAPLRFGAGLKGKLIDALCNGTPFVTTSVGAEGMLDASIVADNVHDDTQHFANCAVSIYTSQSDWEASQNRGFKLINNRFNKVQLHKTFKVKLEELKSDLIKHRQNNVVGQLLHHHTLQSTKYMAKWIEEKNKK